LRRIERVTVHRFGAERAFLAPQQAGFSKGRGRWIEGDPQTIM